MLSKPVLTINYRNDSGEWIPPYSMLQFADDVEVIEAGISVLVVKPTKDGLHFAIDSGNGTDPYGSNVYGQCIKALTGLFWVYYIDADPPEKAWETQVGPKDNEWYVDSNGEGFVYAGLHEPANQRILVMQLSGGGGGAAIGELTSAITPASNSMTGATTFTFKKYIIENGSTKPKLLKEDSKDTDGVNRSTRLSADTGGLVIVNKINGEWVAIRAEDKCPE